jgi:hypothetical protein
MRSAYLGQAGGDASQRLSFLTEAHGAGEVIRAGSLLDDLRREEELNWNPTRGALELVRSDREKDRRSPWLDSWRQTNTIAAAA